MRRLIALFVSASMGAVAAQIGLAGDLAMRAQLAPSGSVRVGVLTGPAASSFAAIHGEDGNDRGVSVDLGQELARRLGVAAVFTLAPNLRALVEMTARGSIDVSVMPIDDAAKEMVDFGPPYFMDPDSFLVLDSDLNSILDLTRRRYVRIVGLMDSMPLRRAERRLRDNSIVAVSSAAEAIEMLRGGTAHAFVLSRDALRPWVRELPGSRILDGGMQTTGITMAVRRDRPVALAYIKDFIEDTKRNGFLRRAFDRAGLQTDAIAPSDERRN